MNHTNWIENVERQFRALHEKVDEAKVMKSLMSEIIIENEDCVEFDLKKPFSFFFVRFLCFRHVL